MKTNPILLAISIAGCATPLLASEAGAPQGSAHLAAESAVAAAPALVQTTIVNADTLTQLSSGRVVKNAPYSADIVSERLQQLGDGNQIVNRSTSLTWRDSAGRTRTEVRDANGVARTIAIFDPVERARWILDPQRKTATRIAASAEMARAEAELARADAERARADAASVRSAADQARLAAQQQRELARQERELARKAAAEARAHVEQLRQEGKLPDAAQVIVKEVQRGGEPREVRIRIAQPVPAIQAVPAAAPQPAARLAAQLGPMIAGASADGKWSATAVTRELGTRDFSGVTAKGVQSSYEIPAGAIGNRQPITVSTETWTAPALQIVVYHKRSDPRSGELVYQLANIKRAEPAGSLFAVPQDYTVRASGRAAREGRD